MGKDILIQNGNIIDGTGKPTYQADFLINGDKIIDIGKFTREEASLRIDAKGLAVAPGFIDAHSHLDFLLPSLHHVNVLENWVRQGSTTIVSGNCGYSPAPINHDYIEDLNIYWNFALPSDGLAYKWNTMAEFFDYLQTLGQTLNVAILTGHNTLRMNVMGFEARLANEEEINLMKKELDESIKAGSIGLSLGLEYVPGIYSNTDELVQLSSVLTKYSLPIVPHTRALLSKLYAKAIEEVIYIADKNSIPLHISHHAGGGIGRTRKLALKAIKEATNRGMKISCDMLAWPNSSTTALSVFPPWMFDGGMDEFFRRIKDPEIRNQAKEEMLKFVPKWPPWENKYWTGRGFNAEAVAAGFRLEKNKKFETKKIKEIATELHKEPVDALIELVIEELGQFYLITGQFENPLAEDFVISILSDPNCSIGNDIVGADLNTISPVAYGGFTKFLGNLARDRGIMTQEEAIRKMTSLPAEQMHLKDRGVIKEGYFADITIFNPKIVKNNASYTNPYQPSEGIKYVLINGTIVLENDKFHADAFAGKVLKFN
jgi:N-acyl-D-amino-acid deacylase